MQNKKLRIGITMRVVEPEGYFEPRDALAQDWSRFIETAFPNANWMALPNIGSEKIHSYCEKWRVNCLILSGGDDIGVNVLRDKTERALLNWAKKNAVPVLGICRGMQLMAVTCGAKLIPVDGHVGNRHKVVGDISHEVNSFHNYGIETCPDGYTVTGKTVDGIIESIRNNELNWEGWMWHPERENPFNKYDIVRIQGLFS